MSAALAASFSRFDGDSASRKLEGFLIFSGGQSWVLRCERIRFENASEDIEQSKSLLLRLQSSVSEESVDHVILVETPQLTTDLESTLKETKIVDVKTKGLLLIHNSDCLPEHKPFSLGNDPKIPVFLITLSSGSCLVKSLVKSLRKQSHKDFQVSFLNYSVDESSHFQFYPPKSGASTDGFHLIWKLKHLMGPFETWKQPFHKKKGKFCAFFQLFEDFDRMCHEKGFKAASIRKKLQNVVKEVRKCMKGGFQQNFLFHLMLSERLSSYSKFTSKVNEYFDECICALGTLCRNAADAVTELMREDIEVPWNGTAKCSTGILLKTFEKFCEGYETYLARKSIRDQDLPKVLLIPGGVLATICFHQEGTVSAEYWKSCIEFICNKKKLSWSPVVSDGILLSFTFYAALLSHPNFGVYALMHVVTHFQILSLGSVRDLVSLLTDQRSLDYEYWIMLSTLLHKHFDSVDSSEKRKRCKQVGNDKLLNEAISLIFSLCNAYHSVPTNSLPENVFEVFESHMGKWLACFLAYFQYDQKWPAVIKSFKLKLPEELEPSLVSKVNDFLATSSSKIPIEVFVSTLTSFDFITARALQAFLKSYYDFDKVNLLDPSWKQLLEIIGSERESQKWDSAKAHVLPFLQNVATHSFKYQLNGQKEFFLALLSLSQPESCPELLTVKGDQSLWTNLTAFLYEYLYNHKSQLRQTLCRVLDNLGQTGDNIFSASLINTYLQVVIPAREELLCEFRKNASVAGFVNEIEKEMKESCNATLSSVSDTSLRCKTLWKILAAMVENVPASCFTFSEISLPVMQLGKLYRVFWPNDCVVAHPTGHQEDYRQWYENVVHWLTKRYSQFIDGDLTREDVDAYRSKYSAIEDFHKSFSCEKYVPIKSTIEEKAKSFLEMETHIRALLCFQVPVTLKWQGIETIFGKWNVALDEFPEELGNVFSFNCGEFAFLPCIKLDQAQKAHEAVTSWLQPIKHLIPMLFHFTANNNVLFSAYLKDEITKQRCLLESQVKLKERSVSRSDSLDSIEEENPVPLGLEAFGRALHGTKDALERLLKREALYKNIIWLDVERVSDKMEEIENLLECPEFECLRKGDVAESVKQDLEAVSELAFFSGFILVLDNVCSQCEMNSVRCDSSYKAFKDVCEIFHRGTDLQNLTTFQCSALKQNLETFLMNTGREKLRFFFALQESDELFQFVQKGTYYSEQGRDRFRQQFQLITNLLQSEEYDEKVLNHLRVAFECIAPFTDPEMTFCDLLHKLKASDTYRYHNWVDQFHTVNRNMTLIKSWFAKSEGDTIKNVSNDLKAIMETGMIQFVLDEDEFALGAGRHRFTVSYTPQSLQLSTTAPNEGKALTEKNSAASDLHANRRTMNLEELQDFVLKLSFIENTENSELHEQKTAFQKQYLLYQRLFKVSVNLFQLGHEKYQETLRPYAVNMPDLQALLEKTNADLEKRRHEIAALRSDYPQLLLFNQRAIFLFDKVLHENRPSCSTLVNLSSKIFDVGKESVTTLIDVVHKHFASASVASQISLHSVGNFVKNLVTDRRLRLLAFPKRRETETSKSGQVLYLARSSSRNELLKFILEVYKGFPESYELFLCSKETSIEQVELFLESACQFPERQFTLLEVNQLRAEQQERILRFQLNKNLVGRVNLCYVLTDNAMFHEVPWIDVIRYKKDEVPLMPDEQVKDCFRKWVTNCYNICGPEIVYGEAGNGKSHYIRKAQRRFGKNEVCVIAVNEAFTLLHAIQKLQQFSEHTEKACLYFNFTVPPPEASSGPCDEISKLENCRYERLMTEIYWFFFSLFAMGFVEDVATGNSFRLYGNCKWHIYIEVASSHNDSGINQFLSRLPLFNYFGTKQEITSDEPLDTDAETQLVCKYLQAYDTGEIDTVHKKRSKIPNEIKFSLKKDLCDMECRRLVKKYREMNMPDNTKNRKVSENLFLKYMARRCFVLDNYSFFNLNPGKQPVLNNETADTSKLGSTLMMAMLEEVGQMCDVSMAEQENCELLIYHVEDGMTTVSFFSPNPDKVRPEKRKRFEALKLKIPDMKDVSSRKVLDETLSKALCVKLGDECWLKAAIGVVKGRGHCIQEKAFLFSLETTTPGVA